MALFTINEKQIIVYGAPGTGKSFGIQQTLSELDFDIENNVIRVVFHKDYTYSDFLGYLTPINKNKNKINYEFCPGPMTIAIEKALEQPKEKICLLIEELNRGNCAAIFGDIFQLLDRNSTGISSYTIINAEVREYLDKNTKTAAELNRWNIGKDDIFIPSNLYIVATMNTADQNVFTMDSAFKRRFKMRYMPIKFDLTEPHLKKINDLSSRNLFNGKHTWSDFARSINAIIDSINGEAISISEDKKLGPYFVDEVDVSCRQAFCDKVIYYLKNDVFKYSEQFFNASYEELYVDFVINNGDIFTQIKETEQ
jgi:5-methylcytosine-specific restriction endonuclease McrBC GTP-binding regulatory subunit McrB